MSDVTIVIPNYNGISFLDTCLRSVSDLIEVSAQIIVVDNGSSDGSREYVKTHFPQCQMICLDKNYGFCRAVNEGIKRADSPYVILLNNDTEVKPDFAMRLLEGIRKDEKRFSCAARMLKYQDRGLLDDAGDFYCALGWSIARGKDQPASRYEKEEPIFSSCAGAAIYRKALVEELGGFDEAHFAYLEDLDLSWRARIQGYENWYIPEAEVFHMGSATSGSRYNPFKVVHSAGNNLYMIYKNMPFLQILLNSPLLLAGILIKYLFFVKKGFGKEYRKGLRRGLALCRKYSERKVRFRRGQVLNCLRIQLELWKNILLFLPGGN
jgi:hypothetical protein